jgi:pantoate--beta-alanine ligase
MPTAPSCRPPAATCCLPRASRPVPRAADLQGAPRPALADLLEGQFRPGFFTGVATVVMKLFSLRVWAKRRRHGGVWQEGLPAAHGDPPDGAAVCAAHRHRGGRHQPRPDGLALSSRNGYLSRKSAQRPWRCRKRCSTCDRWAAAHAAGTLQAANAGAAGTGPAARTRLAARLPDGAPPRRPAARHRLDAPGTLVALGAARLGATRLIDNREF